MIPLKLQLKNFLSYGPTLQTIDFTPYHLICLSGKNGHGKSALLDAMTWSVWGQARKISGVAKADSHLLRLGQTQMLVIFDFEFNKKKYRIRREFAVSYGKQYASLDFGLHENDKIVPLSQKTIRETQAVIETTLGIDFEAFINSAFLRQGQSNEFSKKSPKERKDILGAILGLNHYEQLRKHALDKVKAAQLQTVHLHKFQEKITQELEIMPQVVASLLTTCQELEQSAQQEEYHLEQKKNLDHQKELYSNQKNQQQVWLTHLKQKEEAELKSSQQLKIIYTNWKLLHKNYLSTKNLDNYEEKKDTLLKQITEQQKSIQKNLIVKEHYLTLKHVMSNHVQSIKNNFNQKTNELKTIINNLEHEIVSKRDKYQQLERAETRTAQEIKTISTELEKNKTALIKFDEYQKKLALIEKQFEKRKIFYHKWVASAHYLKTELDSAEQKNELICDESKPSCPLCEQNLSASRKKFLKQQIVKRHGILINRLNFLTRILKELKPILMEQHAELSALKKSVQELELLQFKSDELKIKIDKELSTQKETLDQNTILNNDLVALTHTSQEAQQLLKSFFDKELSYIEQDELYQSYNKQLADLELELKEYSAEQHRYERLQEELKQLEEQKNYYALLQQELVHKQEQKTQFQELKLVLKELRKNKVEITTLLNNFSHLEQLYLNLTIQDQEISNKLRTIQSNKEQLLQRKGSLENQRLKFIHLEQEFKEQQKILKELQDQSFDYQTIALAVSKDGVQALIIENALPEIEQEANTILSQLTDNQSQIIIESLRDLKKGGTKETLDIKISDSAGVRPYELFSGGEAFRIDFALRLAISKLLARRSGTSLQTLIIDEGFGSQDEDGLNHIMDALYKIQESFCKIIIVSHLPSMKEQFPVHFFIEKKSQGSTVRIIEQG